MKEEKDIQSMLNVIYKFVRNYSLNFQELLKTQKTIKSVSQDLFSQETLMKNLVLLEYERKNSGIYNEVLSRLNATKKRYEELKNDHLSQLIFVGTFKDEYNSALVVLKNFKNDNLIKVNYIKDIYDLLIKLKIPKKNVIEFTLYIEKHNSKFPSWYKYLNTDELCNFQKYGYTTTKSINYHDPLIKEKANSILKLLSSYKNIDNKVIKEVLDSVLSNIDERLVYYLSAVVNAIQDTILELINLLLEKEVLFDFNMRRVFIEDIHKNQKLLNTFLIYIENTLDNKVKPINKLEVPKEVKNERTIVFSKNFESLFLLSDIEKYTKDEIEQVKALLVGFKSDTLAPSESVLLKVANKKTILLKGYQVRIICSHIQGKSYNVHGSFIKKKNGLSYEMVEIRKRSCADMEHCKEDFSLVLALNNKNSK